MSTISEALKELKLTEEVNDSDSYEAKIKKMFELRPEFTFISYDDKVRSTGFDAEYKYDTHKVTFEFNGKKYIGYIPGEILLGDSIHIFSLTVYGEGEKCIFGSNEAAFYTEPDPNVGFTVYDKRRSKKYGIIQLYHATDKLALNALDYFESSKLFKEFYGDFKYSHIIFSRDGKGEMVFTPAQARQSLESK